MHPSHALYQALQTAYEILSPDPFLRDYLVQVDADNEDLYLGKAFVALGPKRVFVSYFVLEREIALLAVLLWKAWAALLSQQGMGQQDDCHRVATLVDRRAGRSGYRPAHERLSVGGRAVYGRL
ncbi:MAG: hypothetical protein P8Z75_16395 [Gammaproteobacteria bacterium]